MSSDFLGPPLQKFSEALSRNFKCINRFLSSRAVEWHPLRDIRLKWGFSRAAHSLTDGLNSSSVKMDDLKCPYCSRQFDNRFNRDTHVKACKRQRESGKKSGHGQQSLMGFLQQRAPAAASPVQVQAHAASPMQAHSEGGPAPASPLSVAAPAALPVGAAADSGPMDAEDVHTWSAQLGAR
eukprot:1143089-Pelagomonas_calceolata.AAC.1